MLEDVREDDRIVRAATIGQRLRVDVVHRRAGAGGGVRRGTRIELDPFRVPAGRASEVQKPARVRTDIQEPAARRPDTTLELAKDRMKDQIFVVGLELMDDPRFVPALVVHSIEVAAERRKCSRLAKPATPTAEQIERLARVPGELAILILREKRVRARTAACGTERGRGRRRPSRPSPARTTLAPRSAREQSQRSCPPPFKHDVGEAGARFEWPADVACVDHLPMDDAVPVRFAHDRLNRAGLQRSRHPASTRSSAPSTSIFTTAIRPGLVRAVPTVERLGAHADGVIR